MLKVHSAKSVIALAPAQIAHKGLAPQPAVSGVTCGEWKTETESPDDKQVTCKEEQSCPGRAL